MWNPGRSWKKQPKEHVASRTGQYKGFAEQVLWRFIWQQFWQNGLAENIKRYLKQQTVQNNTWVIFFFFNKFSAVINFSA